MRKREHYIDVLRGISIIGVILIHVICALGGTEVSKYYVFYLGMTRFCVAMFFVCTGSVMLNKTGIIDIKTIYFKRVPRFIIAILIYGYLHKIIRIVIGNIDMDVRNMARCYPKLFFTGELELTFWFMYAVIFIYMILPIIKVFVKHAGDKELKLFLTLWFLTSIVNALVNSDIVPYFRVWLNGNTKLAVAYGYPGYLILGSYLLQKDFSLVKRIVIYFMGTISAIISICEVIYRIDNGTDRTYTLFDYYSPTTIFLTIGVFVFIKAVIKGNSKLKLIEFLGRKSMGIYFIHTMLILVLMKLNLPVRESPCSVNCWAYVLIVVILSGLVTWGMSYIPLIKKIT